VFAPIVFFEVEMVRSVDTMKRLGAVLCRGVGSTRQARLPAKGSTSRAEERN